MRTGSTEGKATQFNVRLDAFAAEQLKALAAASGQSLNSIISQAVREYALTRMAVVIEGQRIIGRYAAFAPIMEAARTVEERAALREAQSQALKDLPPAEPAQDVASAAPADAALEAEPSQTAEPVDGAAPVHAEPSQTVAPAPTVNQDAAPDASPLPASGTVEEEAACMPWAQPEAQDATQGQNQGASQNQVQAPSAPMAEGQDAAPMAGAPKAEAEVPAWVLAARKREEQRLELRKREKEEAEELAARGEERRKQREAAWAAKTAADTARICAKQDMAREDRIAEEEERRPKGKTISVYIAPTDASQGAAPESEEQPDSEEEGLEEPSLTADASPVDTDSMTREELQGMARELKAQGLTYKQIGAKLGKSDRTVMRWLEKE